jgi:predicted transcriptional regulator
VDDCRTPTPRETAILKVLWEHGPRSVKEVHRQLQREQRDRDLAYNTVQTMLRLMEDKRLVAHHVDGRTFVYTACYSRDESARSYLDRVFDGAASQLMLSLLRAEQVPPEELKRIEALIAAARRKRTVEERR